MTRKRHINWMRDESVVNGLCMSCLQQSFRLVIYRYITRDRSSDIRPRATSTTSSLLHQGTSNEHTIRCRGISLIDFQIPVMLPRAPCYGITMFPLCKCVCESWGLCLKRSLARRSCWKWQSDLSRNNFAPSTIIRSKNLEDILTRKCSNLDWDRNEVQSHGSGNNMNEDYMLRAT